LGRALSTANDELSNTTALETEAARGADTLSGDWQRLLNTIKAVSVEAGDAGLLGALRGIVQTTSDVVRVLAGLETGFQGSRERAEQLVAAIKAVTAASAAFVGVRLAASLGAAAAGMIAFSGATHTASLVLGGFTALVSPVTAIAVALGVLAAVAVNVETSAERAAKRLDELTLSAQEGAGATNDYASATEALNAALRSGDLEARRRALIGQVDALEELVEQTRELAQTDSGARVEIEAVTSFKGISRDDVQRQLVQTLGGALEVDLELGRGVTREFAAEIAATLGRLPEVSLSDVAEGIASGELSQALTSEQRLAEASILKLRGGLESLVESTGSAESALEALYSAVGTSDTLPAQVAVEALIERQMELGGQIRGLRQEGTGSAERSAGFAAEADAAEAATGSLGGFSRILARVGVDAALGLGEIAKAQQGARASLDALVEGFRDETRVLAANADDREYVIATIQAEKIARDAGLGSVEKYTSAIRAEIQSQRDLIAARQEIAGSLAAVGIAVANQARDAAVALAVFEKLPFVFGVAASAAREYAKSVSDANRENQLEETKSQAKAAADELDRLAEALRLDAVAAGPGGVLAADLERIRALAKAAGQDADEAEEKFRELFERADELADARLFAEGIVDPIINGLDEAITRGKDLGEVLEDIARNIFRNLFNQLALQPLREGLVNAIQSAKGNVFTPGSGGANVVPFASGGILNGPIEFPISGGRRGIAGESGPEAVIPLARDGSGRLGVRSQGGGMNVTFNITTPDADSFRRSERQIYRNAQRQLRGAG
ncbi:MAG TPA: hypothetical protein VM487_04875, partial [Phycisphaerae bacterium]|nr:hypothetical protein [Phycisphaerae bacterium]